MQRGLCSRGCSGSGGNSGVEIAVVCGGGRVTSAGDDPTLIGEDEGFRGGEPDRLFVSCGATAVAEREVDSVDFVSGTEGGGTNVGREGTGGRGGFSSSSGGGGGGGAEDGRGGAGLDSRAGGEVSSGCFSEMSFAAVSAGNFVLASSAEDEEGGGGGGFESVSSVVVFFFLACLSCSSSSSSLVLSHDIEAVLLLLVVDLAFFPETLFFSSVCL